MAKSIKIRAKEKGGLATVKCLMKHPMETGLRKNKKTGEKIPAHYISEVDCEHNGKLAMTAFLGPGVSKNPDMSFELTDAAKGDMVKITWTDNQGKSDTKEAKIK